jgi:hypothetical protein
MANSFRIPWIIIDAYLARTAVTRASRILYICILRLSDCNHRVRVQSAWPRLVRCIRLDDRSPSAVNTKTNRLLDDLWRREMLSNVVMKYLEFTSSQIFDGRE